MIVVERTHFILQSASQPPLIWRNKKGGDSLIKAFYGSQHFNITTSSGDEIDDYARASVARGNCWCHSI